MGNPLDWLDEAVAALEARGLRRTLAERAGPQRGARIEIDGRTLINFGSNDYLGLAADSRLAAAAKEAIDRFGWGSGASPLVTGRSALHAELERQVAAFEGTEAALLFPSGYAANVGTICALVGKGDVVYSDELNHASIIDGCRLSGAAVHVYRHCDVGHLRQLLSDRGRSPEDLLPEPTKRAPARTERRSGDAGRRLIVTDSLFSMHGDFAPLMDIATLASEFGAMVMADEAHATGVFGARGRGLCEQQGVEPMVPVRMGTLSKALGGHGGFVAGSQHLIDWLANRARPYVYSTAEPAAVAAAGLAALSIDLAPLRAVLLNRARQLREGLASRGLIPDSPTSQIVPVILGAPHRAMAAAQALRTKGFFVPGIRPPSVPDGQSLLRISVTASHTPEDIDCLVAAIHEVAR